MKTYILPNKNHTHKNIREIRNVLEGMGYIRIDIGRPKKSYEFTVRTIRASEGIPIGCILNVRGNNAELVLFIR